MADPKCSKINPRLSKLVQQAGALDTSAELEAVVELAAAAPPTGKLSRPERIKHMREDFEQRSSRVEAAVKKAGGEVLTKAWINGSLLVRLPGGALQKLSELEEVRQLDSPSKLEREE